MCLKFKDDEHPTDPVEVVTIGSKYGRLKKRTLENYCHNEVVTAKTPKCSDGSNKQQGCFLYKTKSDNLGLALNYAIDTAEQFRSFKELGLLPTLDDISAFEFACFESAEKAVRKIENERIKEADKKAKQEAANAETYKEHKPRKNGGFA